MTEQILNSPINLKTNAEARRSVCPFFPGAWVNGPSGLNLTLGLCKADDCMAWRWTNHFKVENREPRPVGCCGRVDIPPQPLTFYDDIILSSTPEQQPLPEEPEAKEPPALILPIGAKI